MNTLSKITATIVFLATSSFCTAMDAPDNSLKKGLDTLLAKSHEKAYIVAAGDPLGISKGCTPLYTQNTDFKEDRKGYFVNDQREYLQIFPMNSSGTQAAMSQTIIGELVTASSSGLVCHPSASTVIRFENINLATKSLQGTYNQSITIWDSHGGQHILNLNFQKMAAAPNTWTMKAQTTDGKINPAYRTGFEIVFDANNNLASVDGDTVNGYGPQLDIFWNSSAPPTILSIYFGDIGIIGGLTIHPNDIQWPSKIEVDGHGIAKYLKSRIDSNTGHLIAEFDDGTIQIYGKIPVVTFDIPRIIL